MPNPENPVNPINRKVAVEGRPSTAPSKPCVRLSPHTAFQLSVAIYALGEYPHLLYSLSIPHLSSIG